MAGAAGGAVLATRSSTHEHSAQCCSRPCTSIAIPVTARSGTSRIGIIGAAPPFGTPPHVDDKAIPQYNAVMSERPSIYLTKAEESLLGAESEYANGRNNNCANRCYYAAFQIKEWLGHSSVATTQIYVHLGQEEPKKAMEATSL